MILRCEICQKEMKEITNTHLKQHNFTVEQYKKQYPDSLVRNPESNKARGLFSKGKTYEERYGVKKAKILRTLRQSDTFTQMKDPLQILVRKEKCGKFKNPEERIKNIRKAITPEVVLRRKKTNLERYGFENPGVLTSGASKAAREYIKSFIKDNNYSEDQCYYDGGGITGREYFQQIYDPVTKQYKFVRYDLVVFNKEKTQILLVLEFNGPWHVTFEEMSSNPLGRGCPFKRGVKIRKDVYEHDLLKIKHIAKFCPKVLIYWLKTKTLIEYTEFENLKF